MFENEEDVREGKTVVETPKCGFSGLNEMYCDQKQGDDQYQQFQTLRTKVYKDELDCNPLTRGVGYCLNVLSAHGTDFETIQRQALYITSENGNANVLRNDYCVKKMIMGTYWALSSKTVTGLALASLILT